jgi:hypothetical protein
MVRSPACLALLGCMLVAACGDGLESDLKKRLAEKYEKALCFTVHSGPFPFTVHPKSLDAPWIDALATGGLLERMGPLIPGDLVPSGSKLAYDLTQEGRDALKSGGQFCYGQTVVLEFAVHTAPAIRDGVESLIARATLRHEVTERWARHPDLLASGKIKVGDEAVEAGFVRRDGEDWALAQ